MPLRQRARPGDDAADEPVGEHPGSRELARRHAALLGVRHELLRQRERLGAELGLHQSPVGARAARARPGGSAGLYLPVSTPRASGLYETTPTPQCGAAGQQLDLDAARHRVVGRLADDRRGTPMCRLSVDHARNAPGAEVGDAEVVDLARFDQPRHRRERLLQRRRLVVAVQVVDVDPVGAEAPQARLDRARSSAATRRGRSARRSSGWPTLVASTQRSRSGAISRPTMRSDSPFA